MNRHAVVVMSSAAIALAVACSAPSDKVDSVAAMGAAAGAVAEPNIAEVRSAIEAANQKFMAAMLAGDATGAASNYADDGVAMWPLTPTWNGRPAIEAGMKEMLVAATINDAKLNTVDVMAAGDLAVETGTFTLTVTPKGGKPVTDKGKYLTVWKRQADGSWKIIRDINNSDGAAPATSK